MKYENCNPTPRNREYIIMEDKSNVLYTVSEVARLLKTNVDYVHRLRKAGLLPFMKLGQYKVRHETLARFLTEFEGKDLTNPFCVKELQNGNNEQ